MALKIPKKAGKLRFLFLFYFSRKLLKLDNSKFDIVKAHVWNGGTDIFHLSKAWT